MIVSTYSDGRIKIRVSKAHQESTLGQTWSKLLKISEELEFDIKPRKMLFGEDFGQPRVDQGHFGHFG